MDASEHGHKRKKRVKSIKERPDSADGKINKVSSDAEICVNNEESKFSGPDPPKKHMDGSEHGRKRKKRKDRLDSFDGKNNKEGSDAEICGNTEEPKSLGTDRPQKHTDESEHGRKRKKRVKSVKDRLHSSDGKMNKDAKICVNTEEPKSSGTDRPQKTTDGSERGHKKKMRVKSVKGRLDNSDEKNNNEGSDTKICANNEESMFSGGYPPQKPMDVSVKGRRSKKRKDRLDSVDGKNNKEGSDAEICVNTIEPKSPGPDPPENNTDGSEQGRKRKKRVKSAKGRLGSSEGKNNKEGSDAEICVNPAEPKSSGTDRPQKTTDGSERGHKKKMRVKSVKGRLDNSDEKNNNEGSDAEICANNEESMFSGGDPPQKTMDGSEHVHKRKKRVKSVKDRPDSSDGKSNKEGSDAEVCANTKKTKSTKKVTFSADVEIFPNTDGTTLIRGKRFAPDEDEMIINAVNEYIDVHGLGEDGQKMVMNCRKHREIKNCWKEIALCIPWRPVQAIYCRAHILFERSDERGFTLEEKERIRLHRDTNGAKWRQIADEMGRSRIHVKDAYRRHKNNVTRGRWNQEEYQNLFDHVNIDLQCKVFEEKKSKHGMLRDNISWAAISDSIGSRPHKSCCDKWYGQLTSPMVAEGVWADTDDYKLIDALYTLDACCMEDIDWDSLVENRPGDVCRKRWTQMVKHIGDNKKLKFADQVDVLMRRYCSYLLEVREEFANRPYVDEEDE